VAAFVVPFGRDGASDRAARAFAAAFEAAGGATLAIENVPGEGGLAGVRRANALAGEGKPTLLLSTPTTHVLLPARLGSAAAADAAYQPLLGLGSAPNVLLAARSLGVDSLAALLTLARSRPLTYASAGAGQTIDMCTRELLRRAQVSMEHRPYDRGSELAYPGLERGEAHVFFDNLLACRSRIASGEVVPLAVSSARRSPFLPQVPAVAETFPGYALDVWLGVFAAHAGDATRAVARRLAADDGLRRTLRDLGLDGGPQAAAAFAATVRDAAWGQIRI
jgi:tripartite-type tricarboxylate transporter receptor subunit TctC